MSPDPIDSADDNLDESSISENENDWVPSSWEPMAKPVRSALKSPDKSSSVSNTFLISIFPYIRKQSIENSLKS